MISTLSRCDITCMLCRPLSSEMLIMPAQAFESASGRTVKYNIKLRRDGDAAAVWAATETAEKVN